MLREEPWFVMLLIRVDLAMGTGGTTHYQAPPGTCIAAIDRVRLAVWQTTEPKSRVWYKSFMTWRFTRQFYLTR